ncbi:MAG: hypothetical protein IE921_00715 [Rhodobacteraceae bacterium]|nr:hypothetical protein [Paracoccaceae bacterium]
MRASYPRAIAWLVWNDDCSWLDDNEATLSITACLVCDLFGKSARQLVADMRKFRAAEGDS